MNSSRYRLIRDNLIGVAGLLAAIVAVVVLRMSSVLASQPPSIKMDMILGTVVLIGTPLALALSLLSLFLDKSKLPGSLAIAAILAGETYRVPLILVNALTLLIFLLPECIVLVLLAGLVFWLRHRRKGHPVTHERSNPQHSGR